MAQRNIYNTSHMFEAEPEQQWNRLHSEEQHLHFARTQATENGPIFHPGDNVSAEQVHYASQWDAATNSNGYSTSTLMVNPPHFQPNTSDPSRDYLHQPAAPTVMIPENHVHHASSSNYAAESNFFDLSVGNVRGPYKRKSPGIPLMSQRGSTSRYHCTGSSSDASSLPDIRQEKSSFDSQHNRWEPLIPPIYQTRHHSNGGESSVRNVRNRSAKDFESDAFRTHPPANYSDYPCSSRLPIDRSVSLHHSNLNSSAPLPEWTPMHVSSAPPGRILSNNLGHESNHLFAGSSMTHGSGELAAYHQEHSSGRNSVAPPSMHTIPSHTRGVRSSFTHRSSPSSRVLMGNVPVGHMVPPNESLQLVGESHSSRHLRPFGSSGWRNGDRNVRPRLSSERYGLFPENTSANDRLTPEGLMIVDRSIYGSRNMLDHHRDMRLDIDHMSYEDLLALGERIGSVSTGVSQDQLQKCLTETVYCSSDQKQEEERCVICLDEYEHMDDVGTLKACGHDYHVSCIKKWLSFKNLCPICKSPAVPENINDK
ncbi:hypothetical protein RND81_01G041200 [Saponaria officinalis]|uniref:RING-type E3 ubiquitin transferase n=1 Tax=Saponaria officinalis TaxID=3572 RepID=A0AAW1N5L4_SAPOF